MPDQFDSVLNVIGQLPAERRSALLAVLSNSIRAFPLAADLAARFNSVLRAIEQLPAEHRDAPLAALRGSIFALPRDDRPAAKSATRQPAQMRRG